jgi:hypothetical protein
MSLIRCLTSSIICVFDGYIILILAGIHSFVYLVKDDCEDLVHVELLVVH